MATQLKAKQPSERPGFKAVLLLLILLPSATYAVDIIVDNKDTTGVSLSNLPGWHGLSVTTAYKGHTLGTFNAGAWTTFRFSSLPVGKYDIYMYWPIWSVSLPDNAVPVVIKHSSGTQAVTVNQQQNGGKWNRLGSWSLDSTAFVTIKNRGAGRVYADAVRLVPVQDPCITTTTTVTTSTTTTTTLLKPPEGSFSAPRNCAEAKSTSDVVFCQDFDGSALGDYTVGALLKDFPGTYRDRIVGITGGTDGGGGRGTIVSGGNAVSGNSLRAKHPKDSLGANSGIAFTPSIGVGLSEAYIGYWVRFDPLFPAIKGGKLPGLTGGTTDSGLITPCCGRSMIKGLGFSSRMMFVGRQLVPYFYWMDNNTPVNPDGSKWGGPVSGGSYTWIPGKWYFIEEHVKLNTPGASNGLFEVWVNGAKVTTIANTMIRGPGASYSISHIAFTTYLGGSSSNWYSPIDTYNFFDVMVISRNRIWRA